MVLGKKKEIILTLEDKYESIRRVRFVGEWLVEPDSKSTRSEDDGDDAGVFWGVASTRSGRYVVTTEHVNKGGCSMTIHDGAAEAFDPLPSNIEAMAWVADTRAQLALPPIEDLDI